jgi:hypothetical protein
MGRKEDEISLGGSDDPTNDFILLVPYYNKLNHFLRSVANQPNHHRVAGKIVGPLANGGHQVSGAPIETYRENKRRMKKF